MKKERVRLFAWCAVLLVLAGIYLAQCIAERRAAERTVRPELILDATADEIRSVSFEAVDHTRISFSLENGVWNVLEPEGESADQEKVRIFISGLTGIAIRRTIEKPEDLAPFGLDDPFTEAVIGLQDGSSVRLAISRVMEGSGLVYVIRDGDPQKVYACAAVLKSNFEKNMDDFRIE